MKKILIANRGEIAIRIARTCRRMGIKTVGIFSEKDRTSLHVEYCDEAYSLESLGASGGALADTYLNVEKIVSIAKRAQVWGVHPGYGFLSERAHFARACRENGIVFIGPAPESIESMGDKIQAKKLMKEMGVPLLPGTEGGVKDLSEARSEAKRIGYPVLLKATAGGGGKGMRIVRDESQLADALENAAREAKAYFGDGTVYIEKYLENPHHIETQVLGDGFGGGGHVFDRECSIQRRHQKLIEESPAPLFLQHAGAKAKILEVSNAVVSKMRYANAGTLEFLGDDEGGFYFLEMNTRLQVEHPVTELVTGLDLVEQQILIAMGKKLQPGAQVSVQNGHAIEVRIYAETPFEYLPTGGRVHDVVLPQGAFVRVDSSIYPGYVVPTDYDPTLMKLSVWGQTRIEAIDRLKGALEELRIIGVQSNQALFWCVMQQQEFREGRYGTPYLQKHGAELKQLYDSEMQSLIGAFAPQIIATSQLSMNATQNHTFARASAWKRGEL